MAKKRQKAGKSSHDPHSEREASKYDQPIPSREFILTTLKQNASLMNRDELGKILGLTSDDNIEALRRRLRAMERDGQLIYTRRGYAPVDELELVRGRVIGHHDGFGFLRPEEGGDDLFLTARQMEKAMHGDRVVARITGVDRRGRKEGMIVDVLEHVNERIVGRFHCEQGVCYVSPENRRICQDIMVPTDRTAGAENGQIVTIHISDYPAHRRQAI
ncbi:MAG TPA: ribonuclease R, partial [Gammaproteobacteria bacterium]|nr:ribonuclease R [Gammaproteobacteria bacterium]